MIVVAAVSGCCAVVDAAVADWDVVGAVVAGWPLWCDVGLTWRGLVALIFAVVGAEWG